MILLFIWLNMWIRFKELITRVLGILKRHPHVCVFIFFLLIHIFIFRNIITHIPAILSGNEVLAREELIPFFDFKTQFFDQLLGGVSPLTQTSEVRISYSFLTAWVRYYAVLPFAVIILPTVSAFLLYLSFYIVAKSILQEERRSYLLPGALICATFLHLILLQSKLTHFYELHFGFSLFAIALSLLVDFFILGPSFKAKRLGLLILVVLFNPGIHYHFLFLFILIPLFIYFFCTNYKDKIYLKSTALRVLVIIIASTLPYLLLILYVIAHSGNVSDSIPLGYSTILYSSVNIRHLLTFGISSQYDMFSQGQYLIQAPRIANVGFLLIILTNFLGFRLWNRRKLLSLGGILVIAILSFWFCLGYLYSVSAHSLLAFLVSTSHSLPILGDLIQRVITNFLHVLRFPHRFEFPYFYALGVLATTGIYMGRMFFKKNYVLYFTALTFISFIPFVVSTSYSTPFLSGNFGDFLKPYPVPSELVQIKSIIDKQPGLSIIFPTFESGRVIAGTQFNFVDKFLIYYINSPFIYYGAAANTSNKFKVFEAYEAIIEGGRWWDKYLKVVLNVDYIIVPHTNARLKGQIYLPKIDAAIERRLATSTVYEVAFQGSQYTLFQRKDIKNIRTENTRALFLDMSHASFGKTVASSAFLSTKIYLPLDASSFVKDQLISNKQVFTDRPRTAYFDLIDQVYSEVGRYFPDDSLAPFDNSYLLSTDYSTTPLALNTLLSENKNQDHPVIKDLVNMTKPNFLITNAAPIIFNDVKIVSGVNHFVVKAATRANELLATVDGTRLLTLKRLEDIPQDNEFVYYSGSLKMDGVGITSVTLQNGNSQSSLAIESLLSVPDDFYITSLSNEQVGSPMLRFAPLTTKNLYRITTVCGATTLCR